MGEPSSSPLSMPTFSENKQFVNADFRRRKAYESMPDIKPEASEENGEIGVRSLGD